MGAHSRLAPSSAHRWLRCPGAPALEATIPEPPQNIFGAEGTAAHLIRSECLELGLEPHDYIGQTLTIDGFAFKIDAEMADHLQSGIDTVRDWDGWEYIEHRVTLDRWLPDTSGTLDYGRVGHKVIRINDLKYGAGIVVSPVENDQLRIYALGFWDNIAKEHTWAEDFELSIDQPRAGGFSEWHVKLDELREFGGWARQAAKATLEPEAPRIPGSKQCQWCRGQSVCPEFQAFNLKIVSQKFEDLDDGDTFGQPPVLPKALTPERRSYVLRHADMFTGWLEMLHGEALNDAAAGRPIPGLKVVTGRAGKRTWTDEKDAEAVIEPLFGAESFTKKLISPTTVEKKLGKKGMAARKEIVALVTKSDGRPCLVPDTDPRPAIKPVSARFEDLTEEDEGA